MHWSFSGKDSAPVMRQRGFESHPVLFNARPRWVQNRNLARALKKFFDNSARNSSTHDVAAAYRLAKAEVRVQLPLGAF